jgi:uncharacterized protein (TIGR03437 family)
VVNAASSLAGPIAPGQIISIYTNAATSAIGPPTGLGLTLDGNGRVATSLGGVQVQFLPTNVYAPLTYVGAHQINAVVPYEIDGRTDVQIQVRLQNRVSNAFGLSVAPTTPGIFTANGTGTGDAAI